MKPECRNRRFRTKAEQRSMKRHNLATYLLTLFRCWALCLIACAQSAAAAESALTMRLEVDAREISRKLLHAREEIPVQPGKLALWFPKWMPGTHAARRTGAEPRGPSPRDAGRPTNRVAARRSRALSHRVHRA